MRENETEMAIERAYLAKGSSSTREGEIPQCVNCEKKTVGIKESIDVSNAQDSPTYRKIASLKTKDVANSVQVIEE